MLMLYGPHTPPKSRAEMEALADLPGIESRLLDRGTLGMAEEVAGDLAPLIDRFLARRSRASLDKAHMSRRRQQASLSERRACRSE